MLCDRLATNPRTGPDRLQLPVWLGKSLHEIKISRVSCDRFTIVPHDIRGHRVIYDLRRPATKEDPAASWVTRKWNRQGPRPFFDGQPIEAETNGRHYADDIFICIFLNENIWIPIKISLKFVPKGPINNIPALVQIKAWRRPGDKPLSEPMMVSLPTHICVARPQWVKSDQGACRFQWRVTPSYCEYSGVTYDLLVSNIGGTYDLADQLPSNHEFVHFLLS